MSQVRNLCRSEAGERHALTNRDMKPALMIESQRMKESIKG